MKIRFKAVISILLCLAMVFSFAGFASADAEKSPEAGKPAVSGKITTCDENDNNPMKLQAGGRDAWYIIPVART